MTGSNSLIHKKNPKLLKHNHFKINTDSYLSMGRLSIWDPSCDVPLRDPATIFLVPL